MQDQYNIEQCVENDDINIWWMFQVSIYVFSFLNDNKITTFFKKEIVIVLVNRIQSFWVKKETLLRIIMKLY